jgi:S1-C subfamily serine protease/pSer/pThr/pTyr-binding forkhead associated (FHA) protein
MGEPANAQIILRHVSGSKVNKIDQFDLGHTGDISLGRDISSMIAFDGPRDDVVSRRHAVIRIKSKDPLRFAIEDLDSSNGTFLDGERVTGEREILPDDVIELGAGGPKLSFDVQPRPADLASRTRVLSTIETTATRVVTAAAAMDAATTQKIAPPQKVGVGKNTVMMLLSDERKRVGQKWIAALAAVIAFVAVGGGVLYWQMSRTTQRLQDEADEQSRRVAQQNERIQTNVATQIGISPADVVSKYGNSTVFIDLRWRLYDKETGRPVFHKTFPFEDEGKRKNLPAYLKLESGKIVRWLTTEDEDRTNLEIGKGGTGSGFVIGKDGFILTNKHVAAGWMTDFTPNDNGARNGVLVSVHVRRGKPHYKVEKIDVYKASGTDDLWSWVPEQDGGMVFHSKVPVVSNAGKKVFYGRNEILEVRFPGTRLGINATLVRGSTDADAALIKIDSPQPLTALDLSADDALKVGERVVVLGYPGVSTKTLSITQSNEAGTSRSRVENIPEPTVTDGIISRLGAESHQQGAVRVHSTMGDAFQLSINTTGAGNSGGPVFNASGKVIGLFTYGVTGRDGTRVSHAVPIKHARALLNPQRTE